MIPWYSLAPPSMVYVFPEPVQKKHVHTCVYLYTHFSLQRKLTRIVSKNIAMSTPNEVALQNTTQPVKWLLNCWKSVLVMHGVSYSTFTGRKSMPKGHRFILHMEDPHGTATCGCV